MCCHVDKRATKRQLARLKRGPITAYKILRRRRGVLSSQVYSGYA